MEWIIVLIMVAVFVISAKKRKMEKQGYEDAKNEWDADQAKYEAVFRKLPEDLLDTLVSLFNEAGNAISCVVSDTYPPEYTKLFLSAAAVKKSGTFGIVTREQHRQISEVLDTKLKWVVNDYIPASNQALLKLANKDGLGFGLITNSAADAMLYSAMDTRERLKGNDKLIKDYESFIDEQIVLVFDRIRQIVA